MEENKKLKTIKKTINSLNQDEAREILNFVAQKCPVWSLELIATNEKDNRLYEGNSYTLQEVKEAGYNNIIVLDCDGYVLSDEFGENFEFLTRPEKMKLKAVVEEFYKDADDFTCVKVRLESNNYISENNEAILSFSVVSSSFGYETDESFEDYDEALSVFAKRVSNLNFEHDDYVYFIRRYQEDSGSNEVSEEIAWWDSRDSEPFSETCKSLMEER